MNLALIGMGVGGLHEAHAQARTRIAVMAFENKVKTPVPDASWKIGEGLAVIDFHNTAVKVGDVFQVYSRGEELIDPATGLKLGSYERVIGSIRVTDVQEQFAVGVIQNATGAMKRGDRVKGP